MPKQKPSTAAAVDEIEMLSLIAAPIYASLNKEQMGSHCYRFAIAEAIKLVQTAEQMRTEMDNPPSKA